MAAKRTGRGPASPVKNCVAGKIMETFYLFFTSLYMRRHNAFIKAERDAGLDIPIWNIKLGRNRQKNE